MKKKLTDEQKKELTEILTENILERYDHPEYWDNSIIEAYYSDCGVEL